MSKKKTRLSKINVRAISLCGFGMHQDTNMVLYKSADFNKNSDIIYPEGIEGESHSMKTLEELQKAYDELKASNEALAKSAEAALAENENLKKEADVLKAASKEEVVEDVTKAMPEEFKKAFDDMRKQNESLAKSLQVEKEKREIADLIKKAEDQFPNVPGEPVQKAMFLREVGRMEKEDKEFALSVLKSANEAIGKSMTEVGTAQAESNTDALDRLNKKAADYAIVNSVTAEKAFSEVTKTAEGKKLYKEAFAN